MKTILGIDVGINGALSFYDGEELIIYDMPTYKIKVGKYMRNRVYASGLIKILSENKCDSATVEAAWPRPNDTTTNAWTSGYGIGIIESCLTMFNIPFTNISPQKWKKAMQCPKDKDAARMRASQLLPEFAHNWPFSISGVICL